MNCGSDTHLFSPLRLCETLHAQWRQGTFLVLVTVASSPPFGQVLITAGCIFTSRAQSSMKSWEDDEISLIWFISCCLVVIHYGWLWKKCFWRSDAYPQESLIPLTNKAVQTTEQLCTTGCTGLSGLVTSLSSPENQQQTGNLSFEFCVCSHYLCRTSPRYLYVQSAVCFHESIASARKLFCSHSSSTYLYELHEELLR